MPIAQEPSGHSFKPEGHRWNSGQFSIESRHELSQHLTGWFIGHIIPVGHESISVAQEKSNWQRTSLLRSHILVIDFFRQFPFKSQFPSQHFS